MRRQRGDREETGEETERRQGGDREETGEETGRRQEGKQEVRRRGSHDGEET